MPGKIQQAIEPIINHPNTTPFMVVMVAWLNSWWLDYGEWFVKMLTAIFGLVVLILLSVKHFLDIRKELRGKSDRKPKDTDNAE